MSLSRTIRKPFAKQSQTNRKVWLIRKRKVSSAKYIGPFLQKRIENKKKNRKRGPQSLLSLSVCISIYRYRNSNMTYQESKDTSAFPPEFAKSLSMMWPWMAKSFLVTSRRLSGLFLTLTPLAPLVASRAAGEVPAAGKSTLLLLKTLCPLSQLTSANTPPSKLLPATQTHFFHKHRIQIGKRRNQD